MITLMHLVVLKAVVKKVKDLLLAEKEVLLQTSKNTVRTIRMIHIVKVDNLLVVKVTCLLVVKVTCLLVVKVTCLLVKVA